MALRRVNARRLILDKFAEFHLGLRRLSLPRQETRHFSLEFSNRETGFGSVSLTFSSERTF